MDEYNVITARVNVSRYVFRNFIYYVLLQVLALIITWLVRGDEPIDLATLGKALTPPVMVVVGNLWLFFSKKMEGFTVAMGETSVFGPSNRFAMSGLNRIERAEIDMVRSKTASSRGGSIRAVDGRKIYLHPDLDKDAMAQIYGRLGLY